MKTLTIIKPDDWHLHLREGLVLKNIIHFTSEFFGRAIVMPNTKTPITSVESAISYKKSIVEALPESSKFEPLMTMYLTDETCLLYTSPSPRDRQKSRMPSSA